MKNVATGAMQSLLIKSEENLNGEDIKRRSFSFSKFLNLFIYLKSVLVILWYDFLLDLIKPAFQHATKGKNIKLTARMGMTHQIDLIVMQQYCQ